MPAARARSIASGATCSGEATAGGDLFRSSSFEGTRWRNHVNGGGGAHRLGQDVGDACAFHDGAHGATGDYTGTRGGRTQQDGASSVMADHGW